MTDIPQDAINEAILFKKAIDRLLAMPFCTTAMAVVAVGHMAKSADRGGAAALLRQMADQIDPPTPCVATGHPFYDLDDARNWANARKMWVAAEKVARQSAEEFKRRVPF